MKGTRKKTNSLRQDPKVVAKKIGGMIKKRRKAVGYTSSEDFAYDIPMNRSQYGKYEKGKEMEVRTLLRIVNALGLTLEEFFDNDRD